MSKFKIKNMKGITLIALIITIIVLLILAGVVINMTLGNDGIISKAQGAVDAYKNAQEKEDYEIAKTANILSSMTGGSRLQPGSNLCSPILLVTASIPSSESSDREAGSYYATSNLYDRVNS